MSTRRSTELKRKDMDYALSLIRQGVLSIDDEGCIWRYATVRGKLNVPRRAEIAKNKGYLALTLQMPDGNVRSVMAHRVIWEWSHGPIPEGLQINHKDLNKQNNRLDNLELVTNLENMKHSFAHGRTLAYAHRKKQDDAVYRGDRRLISETDKIAIRRLRASGLSLSEIASQYSCSPQRISQILKEAQ